MLLVVVKYPVIHTQAALRLAREDCSVMLRKPYWCSYGYQVYIVFAQKTIPFEPQQYIVNKYRALHSLAQN